jgi:hypothetical protein
MLFLHFIAMLSSHCTDDSLLISSVQPVVMSSSALDRCSTTNALTRYIPGPSVQPVSIFLLYFGHLDRELDHLVYGLDFFLYDLEILQN